MEIKTEIAKPILRISMSLVFLYFGFQQILSPNAWTGFVPDFVTSLVSPILTANNIVMMNGILEITLGIFLIIGIYTRFSAIILSLHLLGIAASVGFSPIGARDFGLAMATLAAFFNGPDKYCLDMKFKKVKKE